MRTSIKPERNRWTGLLARTAAGVLGLAVTAAPAWAQYDVPALQMGYPNPFSPTTNVFNRNAAYTPGGGGTLITNVNGGVSGVTPSGQTRFIRIGTPVVGLTSQYGIGDLLPRPEGVPSDWVAVIATNQGNPNCVQWLQFSNTNILIAVDEGVAFVRWATNSAATSGTLAAYVVGPNLTRRPVRLFWTEGQYAGPRVQFGNNYEVRIWYNSQITDPALNPSNAIYIANDQIDKVSPATILIRNNQLRALSGVSGRVLITYARRPDGLDPNVRELLDYEVIDVLEPRSSTLSANVGDRLLPRRSDYPIDNVFCDITRGGVDSTGQRPDEVFTYKHVVGARNGWVWAIRPTDAPWQIEIFWKAKEKMDVIWPFEVDIYDVQWDLNSQLCALPTSQRGGNDNGVFFPPEVTAEVMPYQAALDTSSGQERMVKSSTAVARIVSRIFRGTKPGMCTMKYTAGDDVWFETVRLAWETNSLVYQGVRTWTIGNEARPFLKSGLSPQGYDTWPGLIRLPATLPTGGGITNVAGDRWDRYEPNLYRYPVGYPVHDTDLESQVMPVNLGHLGVWWWNESRLVAEEGMPAPIYWPSLVCDYRNVWPDNPRQIVIASFQGSVSDTWLADQTGSLQLPGVQAGEAQLLVHPARTNEWTAYSYTDGFTFETWVRSSNLGGKHGLMTMRAGGQTNLSFFLENGVPAASLFTWQQLTSNTWVTATQTWYGTEAVVSGTWTHVAMSLSGSDLKFYVGGIPAGSAADGPSAFAPRLTDPVALGMLESFRGSPVSTQSFGFFQGRLDEVRLWSGARTDEAIAEDFGSPLEAVDQLVGRFVFDPAAAVDPQLPAGSTKDMLGNFYIRAALGAAVNLGDAVPLVLPGQAYADQSPEIYYENDASAPGYNPNEEHALMVGPFAYALRSDLNIPGTSSEPFVLVEYTPDAASYRRAIDVYQVVPTNVFYPSFEQNIEAGKMIQPPAPLRSLLPDNCINTYAAQTNLANIFRDRRKYYWAKQAGDNGGHLGVGMHFFYPMQIGFWIPQLDASKQPAPTTEVPWLSALNGDTTVNNILKGAPVRVTFDIQWPSIVPTLNIGDSLTLPKNGLPAIRGQKSVSIVYQQSLRRGMGDSAVLIDPTRARKTAISQVPPNMRAMRDPRSGNTFFSDLDPDLRERLFYVPTASTNERLWLKGLFVNYPNYHYLRLNLMTPDLVASATNPKRMTGMDNAWSNAVVSLPTTRVELADENTPFDSAAMVTPGLGYGYVSLVFNNSGNIDMVDPGDPISMQVIRIDTNLFGGRIDPILSANPLDKYQTLRHISDFAGEPHRWVFQWMYSSPDSSGMAPTNDADWLMLVNSETGRYTTVFGSSGEFGLADAFVRCRYRALDPDVQSVVGTGWSAWTDPVLCEGWIKRVLKAINPFDQRIRDYMNYALNTDLSMIQQAGQPYAGDVPLNMEALNDYGLIPIYQTVLEQSRDLSIDSTLDTTPTPLAVCLALTLAAGRLNDLYMVLGNEAYADALNPSLALGLKDPALSGEASSIFAFQGIVPTLLDEELALLRGRDCSAPVLPPETEFPIYNRLPWNFTADITHGQVAYVLNYGISDLKGDQNGVVDAADAAALYPQGHGDAWGHYLAATKVYYELFRHRNFTWFPQLEGIRVGSVETTMSALHEKKFAAAAAAKARAGLAIVDRTYRQSYAEGDSEPWRAERDSRTSRGWGVGEWAGRASMGAYFDWVMANGLLPHETTQSNLNPLAVINRTTVPELTELVLAADRVQQQVDMADRALNPLGLGVDSVPFDISPAQIDAGHTHFEQAHDKAIQALKVAKGVFDRVQACTAALRDQNEERDFDATVLRQEQTYDRQLIGIYGFPYQEDMGPGKLYPEGYTGPDLTHYNFISRYDFFGSTPFTSSTLDMTVVVPKVVNGGIRTYDPGEIVPAPTYTDPALTLEAILQFLPAEYSARFNAIKEKYTSVANTVNLTKDQVDSLGVPELSQFFGEVLGKYGELEMKVFEAMQGVVSWFDGAVGGQVDALDDFISQWVGTGAKLDPLKIQGPNIVYSTNRFNYWIGVDGLPAKPSSYQSARRAEGEIQIALSQYVLSLRDAKRVIDNSQALYKALLAADANYRSQIGAQINTYYGRVDALDNMNTLQQIMDIANKAVAVGEKVYTEITEVYEAVQAAIPAVAGMSFDIGAAVRGPVRAAATVGTLAATIQKLANFQSITATEEDLKKKKEIVDLNAFALQLKGVSAESAAKVVDAAIKYIESLNALDVTLQNAETFRMQYARAIAEGDMLQVQREQDRRIWASDLSVRRYRNMAYQIFRNDDLARYDEAFTVASRYVYLAAKAYDYETGLLRQDGAVGAPGREFLSQIVKARALGRFTYDGTPLPGGATGDPGLADIMARMEANWSVLKGRLNFNNPQTETGAFSLRAELLRIPASAAFDKAWRDKLSTYVVGDVRDLLQFKTLCLPFTPSDSAEPALVIPFSTTVDFRKNFFGLPLSAGDNAYDSTHFATKVRGVGVWFANYRNTSLANQPRVYLVPAGEDHMRVPDGVGETVRSWSVLDQALPIPYPLSNESWMRSDWHVSTDVLGGEFFLRRRYASMRAYHDSGFTTDEMTFNSRLIGRSVWNGQWLLIIPGGTLLSDAGKGLKMFINGKELAPGAGVYDGQGVKDIKLFFQTYSYSGN